MGCHTHWNDFWVKEDETLLVVVSGTGITVLNETRHTLKDKHYNFSHMQNLVFF